MDKITKDYTFVTRLDHGHPVECHICGISNFDHLHRAGTDPKDFERLEEEITTSLVNVDKIVNEILPSKSFAEDSDIDNPLKNKRERLRKALEDQYIEGFKAGSDATEDTLDDLQQLIPEFVETEYPKGDDRRGMATVNITLFTEYLRKRELKDKE